ncbi:MAG: hypothetical protein ABF289_16830 [Clostridiales bacterium]
MIINPKKIEALTMFYSGDSKSSICKKLKIKNRLIKKWIINDKTSIKEKVQNMYYFGYSDNKICKCFFLKRSELSKIVEEIQIDISKHALNNDIKLVRRQDGYSFWVENILKTARIS